MISNINDLSGANTNSLTSANNTTRNKPSERDMFMTLLVAQLKNQDPLAPQDGSEFVAQLAQFNSLDQLINMRQSLEQLVAKMNTPSTLTEG